MAEEDFTVVRIFIEGVAEEAGRTAKLHQVSGAFVLIELEPVGLGGARARADPLRDEFSFDEDEREVGSDPARARQAQAIADAQVARMPAEVRRSASRLATARDRKIDLDETKK